MANLDFCLHLVVMRFPSSSLLGGVVPEKAKWIGGTFTTAQLKQGKEN